MAAPLNTCTTIEQRGVVRFLWAKNMDAAKDIHIFCPQKMHNTTLFYGGTCIQGRRHLVTCYVYTVMRIPIVVRHNKTR
jgi:hypothetical protein